MSLKIYGANAKVFIQFNQGIEELAQKLSTGLELPKIRLNYDEYPPHEMIGMCEVLGFAMWLYPSNIFENCKYEFSIETEECVKEINSKQMCDLSLWLARYISVICKLETMVVNFENNSGIAFIKGELKELANIKKIDIIE